MACWKLPSFPGNNPWTTDLAVFFLAMLGAEDYDLRHEYPPLDDFATSQLSTYRPTLVTSFSSFAAIYFSIQISFTSSQEITNCSLTSPPATANCSLDLSLTSPHAVVTCSLGTSLPAIANSFRDNASITEKAATTRQTEVHRSRQQGRYSEK